MLRGCSSSTEALPAESAMCDPQPMACTCLPFSEHIQQSFSEWRRREEETRTVHLPSPVAKLAL
jgi:hypothetical protein